MNRKERRFAEKVQEKKAGYKTAPAVIKQQAESFKTQGLALRSANNNADAIPLLIEALKLDSSLADVHFMLSTMQRTQPELGIDMNTINGYIKNKKELKDSYKAIQDILRQKRLRAENLICQEEICRLLPDDDFEKAEYALLLNVANRNEDAIKIMAELVNRHPANKIYKGVFVSLMDMVSFSEFEPEVKKALQFNFDDIYTTNLYRAFPLWLNTVINDPACQGIRLLEGLTTDSEIFEWLAHAPLDQTSFMNDRFFLSGIRLLVISSVAVEDLFARLRRGLCLNLQILSQNNRLSIFENFIFAMGEQSFFNEYIYAQPEDEKVAIRAFIKNINSNTSDSLTHAQAYGIISCYQSLHDTFADKKDELQELARKSPAFAQLFKTQFLDIEEENNIKADLASFGMLENEISKNVQAQYEQNPYPRWVSCMNYTMPNSAIPFDEKYRRNNWKILIAGCGTGRHAIHTATTFPNAHVTAIDISRASLAYAQRKTREAGLSDRIDFIHADILSMGDWPKSFDIIESSGVLHHMEDPMKGWQTLCNRLKPGGYFKIGLYSEVARREIVEARHYIKELGFESTLEGIRACREIFKQRADDDSIRKWLINTVDFYNASSLRDLLFHIQEHRMNLPQIKGMLDQLGLFCINFLIPDSQTVLSFETMFPEDKERKDLINWHKFELENPQTFKNMYQFWSQKR